jgi:hypothetical protein
MAPVSTGAGLAFYFLDLYLALSFIGSKDRFPPFSSADLSPSWNLRFLEGFVFFGYYVVFPGAMHV